MLNFYLFAPPPYPLPAVTITLASYFNFIRKMKHKCLRCSCHDDKHSEKKLTFLLVFQKFSFKIPDFLSRVHLDSWVAYNASSSIGIRYYWHNMLQNAEFFLLKLKTHQTSKLSQAVIILSMPYVVSASLNHL